VYDAVEHTRFALGSDTVCTSLLSSLRMVLEATPVVALLKCFTVRTAADCQGAKSQ